jgi:GH15 family glucan-1,4-alpha-glucosidase
MYWEEWVRGLAVPVDYQEAVIRAAITLKLCTFEDTGAMLAALTTSIPEAPDTIRNWDYRFCWLRDSYFTVHALNRLGASQTMRSYLRFIHNTHVRTPVGDLQPLYGISGQPQLVEVTVPSLRGYRGMAPVRVGNQAFEQKQYDVYGAIILGAAQLFYDERLDVADPQRIFTGLERIGEHAVQGFARPDAGPWELRGSEHVHTYSAVMCWAECDRLADIALRVGQDQASARWREHADSMHARIIAEAWYVNALAAIGRKEEARERFAQLLSRRNSFGLLSEDIDPQTGELWGNFPQSYSMVGIIISAMRLSRYWEDVV